MGRQKLDTQNGQPTRHAEKTHVLALNPKNTMGFGKNKSRPLGERLQILLQHLVDELP